MKNRKMLSAAFAVVGEQVDHGLVWEDGSLELGTVPAGLLTGKEVRENLPEGDGERILRRFIDDSINLLSEHPVNHQREEEGLPPLNLLWPWGPGFRTRVPNLALRRGMPTLVMSSSLRMQGLTRLAGYRHSDRGAFGRGLKINFAEVVKSIRASLSTVAVVDSFSWIRQHERYEEGEWLTREIDARLLTPLVELARKEEFSFTLLAPGGYTGAHVPLASPEGLGLSYSTKVLARNTVPFDERALEERLPGTTPWHAVAAALEA